MSFNPNIPQPGDFMNPSGFQMQANFTEINDAFIKNHIGFTSPNAGKHTTLKFSVQPNPTTSSTQVSLFTKLVSGKPQLFFAPPSSATPIQMTYESISTGLQSSNPDVYLPDQYSFMAGPFIIYMGTKNNLVNGSVINLTPMSTIIFCSFTVIQSTGGGSSFRSSEVIGIPLANTITVRFQGSGFVVNKATYFAVGVP